ncbi:UNVERIFIED_ORG: hypothetical protein LHJ69_05855 [Shinella sp. XGS7]|nr:hypothetical protein [Shinella sp. XGS7]
MAASGEVKILNCVSKGISVAIFSWLFVCAPAYAEQIRWVSDANGCMHAAPKSESQSVAWSGACLDGFGSGDAIQIWHADGKEVERYAGPLVQGRRHGRGIVEYSDGSVFDGMFLNGAPKGEGVYVDAEGKRQRVYASADGRGLEIYCITPLKKPELPTINWSGSASYRSSVRMVDGLVTNVNIVRLKGSPPEGVDLDFGKSIKTAISDFRCWGQGAAGVLVVQQEFYFSTE